MTYETYFKAGLFAAVTSIGAALCDTANAGEYTAELNITESALTAGVELSDFQRGEVAFSQLHFSVDKKEGRDADLVGKTIFTFGDKFAFSAEAAFTGETGETVYQIAAGVSEFRVPTGVLSFGVEAKNAGISGSATLANGSVFGLRDVNIMSEFQKDYGGAGKFSMSFNGKAKNGFAVTGSANFDTSDPSKNSFGLNVSGKF